MTAKRVTVKNPCFGFALVNADPGKTRKRTWLRACLLSAPRTGRVDGRRYTHGTTRRIRFYSSGRDVRRVMDFSRLET